MTLVRVTTILACSPIRPFVAEEGWLSCHGRGLIIGAVRIFGVVRNRVSSAPARERVRSYSNILDFLPSVPEADLFFGGL